MMDDTKPTGDAHASPDAAPDGASPEPAAPAAPAATPEPSAAVMKFKSCRWRCDPEMGEFCTHRDVLPFAGKEGFKPESWCPECAFFKLRRTPKKREHYTY
jgi:hypothetical protein